MSRIGNSGNKVKCGHPSCDQAISRKQFACTAHWYSLPKDMRNRMYAAARQVWAGISKDKLDRLYAIHDEARAFWATGS